MSNSEEFNIGYASADVYEKMLPPHYYGGKEDTDLIRSHLHQHLGPAPAEPTARVLDLGCGPGRITTALAPYAAHLCGTDKSQGMIDTFQKRFPGAESRCQDTESALKALHGEGVAHHFDLIGSFWSLSYPLLECFEETNADDVLLTSDPETGRQRAADIVRRLVELLAPGGHLIMLFFDAHTEEQRLVTSLWERIAPFPGTGRDYTWRLLEQGLLDAEASGMGAFSQSRLPGVALAADRTAAREWFLTGHLNSHAALRDDPDVHQVIDAFVAQHTTDQGSVLIPSAVRLIHFHATTSANHHLPAARF